MKEHWVRIMFSDKQGNFPLVNTENWQVVPYNNSHSMECARILQSFFAFCYIHIQWSNLHVEWTLYLCIHLVTSSMCHFGIMAKNQTERKALETVGKNFHSWNNMREIRKQWLASFKVLKENLSTNLSRGKIIPIPEELHKALKSIVKLNRWANINEHWQLKILIVCFMQPQIQVKMHDKWKKWSE